MVKTCLKTHMTMQCCHNPHQQQILRNRSFRPLFIIFQCVQRSKPCFFLFSISCSHETSFHGPYGCCNLAPLKLRYSNQLTLFRHFRPFFLPFEFRWFLSLSTSPSQGDHPGKCGKIDFLGGPVEHFSQKKHGALQSLCNLLFWIIMAH